MLNFNLSILPLIVLSVVNFVLSWIWYSPLLFAKPWMKALGIDEKHEMSEDEKRKMSFLFISGIISSLLTVTVLMVIINSLQIKSFISGMLAGLLIWIGFVLTHSLNTLWEGRRIKVLLINNGLYFITYIVYGGLIAIWK
jgi:hypothetical protein